MTFEEYLIQKYPNTDHNDIDMTELARHLFMAVQAQGAESGEKFFHGFNSGLGRAIEIIVDRMGPQPAMSDTRWRIWMHDRDIALAIRANLVAE